LIISPLKAKKPEFDQEKHIANGRLFNKNSLVKEL